MVQLPLEIQRAAMVSRRGRPGPSSSRRVAQHPWKRRLIQALAGAAFVVISFLVIILTKHNRAGRNDYQAIQDPGGDDTKAQEQGIPTETETDPSTLNGNIGVAVNEETLLRIQIVSDLHIEFYGNELPPDTIIEPQAPILALLGDVGYAMDDQYRRFLLRQCDRFEQVFFLAGNHEFYNHQGTTHSMTEQRQWMEQVATERENLHYLEQASLLLVHGVRILATTLWSEIPDHLLQVSESSLNDYRISYNHVPGVDVLPRRVTANETRHMHRTSLAWLTSELQRAQDRNEQVLVLTHHTPLLLGTSNPKYDGSDLTHCFSSDLRYLLQDPIVAWACGHTHYNFDISSPHPSSGRKVRVLSNQRGYKHDPKPDYNHQGVVLEIPAKSS